jgi:small subunit ribosomal protein S17
MAAKSTVRGVVVSDRMDKTVVVAVERQVRHHLYGKIQRRTSRFVAHNEGNEAKTGDLVDIAGSRPLSRRKRWVVKHIVRRAFDLRAREAASETPGAPGTEGPAEG